MFDLLFGVEGDQIHALGLAEGNASSPVEVVATHPPGQQIVLSLPLVVALRPGGLLKCLWLSWVDCGGSDS